MILTAWIVIVVVAAAVVASGQPQRARQSPLSMGLKMLGDLRDNMTKTLQGIFGGGSSPQQPKNVPRPQQAPLPQQQQLQRPQFSAPPSPQFSSPPRPRPSVGSVLPPVLSAPSSSHDATAPPSSFFTVVHQEDVPTPDPHSRDPPTFLPPPSPFQGTVDEDHLPRPSSLPLVDNNHLPPFQDSFPPHTPSSTGFTSFGGHTPGDSESSNIPFDNGATFSLGAFRHEPAPHSLLHPEQAQRKSASLEHTPSRDNLDDPHHQHHHVPQLEHQPAITLLQASTESVAHPTVTILSHSLSPTHVPLQAPQQDIPESRKDAGPGLVNAGLKMEVKTRKREDGTTGSEVSGYEFGYGVLDRSSGNQFFHAEKREEGQTKGSYKIQLPDGRIQTVTYVANNHGFQPRITYDGEAHYPVSTTQKP
ncbi:hypothetical protein Pcinc_037233 [Petrolisthes cinctipes]|uniref:Pro-resilin-like n=1 Tax=Petrolisthes cinctipes TaxID=88211 RepID=A0AAE1ELU0_PETCI|nr:hypothetical protein Pcinc_037233 [Petrolisthes cinctipes]